MTDGLKDCPMCGTQEPYVYASLHDVHCNICGASAPKEVWNRRQPDAALVDALEVMQTLRDYVSDASRGLLTYEGSGEGFIAMATEDLARIDALLAAHQPKDTPNDQ